MKFLFASDSFKGTLSSPKTAELLTDAAREIFPDCICDSIEVADGGEGTTDAVLSAVNGKSSSLKVHGPLWEELTCSYGMLDEKRAVMEMAAASGLPLVPDEKRDPRYTTSYGTGEMILDALNAGKNVVSANKDLIAEHGKELLDAAEEHGVDFLFEAAVAGGIPIIRPLKQCLAANEIDEVIGIMNGTTNYILTKMFEDNMDFDEALAKATELGYAEADPTADVEGLDAGRKAAILASIAFHSRVVFKDVYTEGITKISSRDIAYAKEFGNVIKLLGVAHNTEDGIEVGVYPMMISQNHPLASVRDSFNAVFVHGDAVGDVMFYGRGAGEFPTASAVVGDVIDVVRDTQYHCTGRISCTCYRTTPVKNFKNVKNKFFLRMQVENKPGVLASIAMVFGVHKVSITKVMQKEQCENADVAELVIVTEAVKESQMLDSLEHLKDMETIREVSSVIREY